MTLTSMVITHDWLILHVFSIRILSPTKDTRSGFSEPRTLPLSLEKRGRSCPFQLSDGWPKVGAEPCIFQLYLNNTSMLSGLEN